MIKIATTINYIRKRRLRKEGKYACRKNRKSSTLPHRDDVDIVPYGEINNRYDSFQYSRSTL